MQNPTDSSISSTLEGMLTEAGQRLLDMAASLALLPGTVADLELLICPPELMDKVAARLAEKGAAA